MDRNTTSGVRPFWRSGRKGRNGSSKPTMVKLGEVAGAAVARLLHSFTSRLILLVGADQPHNDRLSAIAHLNRRRPSHFKMGGRLSPTRTGLINWVINGLMGASQLLLLPLAPQTRSGRNNRKGRCSSSASGVTFDQR